jgi:hypothetical protein
MGTAEGQVRTKENRSTSQESSGSEANEPGSAKEVVGAGESALGGEEEGWRYVSLEPELAATISMLNASLGEIRYLRRINDLRSL